MIFADDIQGKKILLHACCGPCSLGALDPLLSDGALVTLYFYNPCIIDGEFEKRLAAIELVARHYGVPLVAPEHDYSAYLGYAAERAGDAEGGTRCSLCFSDRLKASAKYAADNGFDAFSTTLTVSPHKDAKRIFEIADRLSDAEGVPFLARDFKKRDGFLRSTRLSRELGIYRQNFCGCEFSRGGGQAGS